MKSAKEKYRHKSSWRKIFIVDSNFIQTVILDESGKILKKQRNKPRSNREKMKIYLENPNEKKEENNNVIENDEKQKENDYIKELNNLTSFNDIDDQFDDIL